MDKSILYAFIFYITFIIVPLVPALLIYKLLPKEKIGTIGVGGVFGNFRINATGALGAYLLIAGGSFYLFNPFVQGQITDVSHPTWKVISKVDFVDTNGSPLPTNELIPAIDVTFRPEPLEIYTDMISFKVSGKVEDILISINGKGNNFRGKNFNLAKDRENIKIDEAKRTIDLGTITLQQYGAPPNIETAGIKPDTSGPPVVK